MATIYEIRNVFIELLEIAQDPDVDPQVIADTMESIEGEFEDKADSYVVVMKELQAQADKFGKEIERLTTHKTTISNNINRMKSILLESMHAIGKDKLQTEHFKLSVRKNGGLAPLKITGDVPDEFCKFEPDNAKIRAALDEGENLDFAELDERGVHLDIR